MASRAIKYRHQTASFFHSRTRLKIGLIGGSFNPAHAGHLHVAIEAHRQLGLDQIWLLVSPQNPLKTSADMAPLDQRLAGARVIAAPYPFLRVLAVEENLPNNYTYNTMNFMKKTMPLACLVWIMGADNLGQLAKWHRHQELINLLPIAVIDRPSYSLQAIAAGKRLFRRRYKPANLKTALAGRTGKLPAWCFIAGRKHTASATAIRERENYNTEHNTGIKTT